MNQLIMPLLVGGAALYVTNLLNIKHRLSLKWYLTSSYVKSTTSCNDLKPLLYYKTQNSKQLFQNTFLALTCLNMSFWHLKVPESLYLKPSVCNTLFVSVRQYRTLLK